MVCTHKALGHKCQNVVDVEAKEIETVKSLVAETKSKISTCEEVSGSLENLLDELQQQRDDAHGLITETFHTYKAMLEKKQVKKST